MAVYRAPIAMVTTPSLFVALLLLASVQSTFINFKPGFEYQYKYNSKTALKNVGDFHVTGRVGFINVDNDNAGQEIYVRVYALAMKTAETSEPVNHQWDLSKWFSFVITPHGEITHVYHPPDDDKEALVMKKGFAGLFASRLHHESETLSTRVPDGWQYSVQESGQEGLHNATYTVKPTSDGHVFTKTKRPEEHPVKHSSSNYTKTLVYNRELGTIHSVMVDEEFQTMHKVPEGFDPHANTRRVKPVNEPKDVVYPEMSAMASGRLEFLTKHAISKFPSKGTKKLSKASIHIGNVKPKKAPVDVEQHIKYLTANLTCLREHSEKDPKLSGKCFTGMMYVLHALPDKVVDDIGKYYLGGRPKRRRDFQNQNHIMDGLAALNSELSQTILYKYVLNNTRYNQLLIKRLLVHFVSMEDLPIDLVLNKLIQLTFAPPKSLFHRLDKETYHRVVLATGVMAHRLWNAGRKEESMFIVNQLEKWLGLHDPWAYRKKRETMSELDALNVDHWKVILIGALGNAGLDRSYEHIVSHVNSTNSQWVKRAGIHALRKYFHEESADLMLRTALYDDDDKVRYEALLQYQAHPKAALLAPRYMEKGEVNGSVFYADPSDVGMTNFILHKREKRETMVDKIVNVKKEIKLQSPTIDWQKMLGSTKIGAAFGLIVKNGLDLRFSLINSHAKLDIHDEAYARVYLGFCGKVLEFFHGRVCFKGGAGYDLNVVKENAHGDLKRLVDLFDKIKNNAVGAIDSGLSLFKKFADGDTALDEVLADFKAAVEDLPNKFVHVAQLLVEAMKMIGHMHEEDLPPFFRPAQHLIIKINNMIGGQNGDVMTFFNKIVDTVTVVLPNTAKAVFKDLNGVIHGLRSFDSNPKESMINIAGNIMELGEKVSGLFDTLKEVKESAFFLREQKPEWMNMGGKIEEIMAMSTKAITALAEGAGKWLMEDITGNDPIAEFSNGKTTQSTERKKLLDITRQILDDLSGPLKGLKNIGADFFSAFTKIYRVINDVKEAMEVLQNGFGGVRGLIDRIFGPKVHAKFPKKYREDNSECSGMGIYPAKLGNGKEYPHEGVDLVTEGQMIVAPLNGLLTESDQPNEVFIDIKGGSLKDTHIVITNIKLNETFKGAKNKKVFAGMIIGEQAPSPCGDLQHIHVTLYRDGGYIDPTMYLESRIPGLPSWKQGCDDYKLVLKMETIAEGCILCLDGKNKVDVSPDRNGKIPEQEEIEYSIGDFIDHISDRFAGAEGAVEDALGGAGGGLGGADEAFSSLFSNIGTFLSKFSINDLKLGSIIDLLDILELTETEEKVADVIKTFKEMIDNKPCFNPYQLTDDQLRAELRDRGKNAQGSRKDMIKSLTTPSNSCPLWKIAMPKNIYCTFDTLCLGIECCVYFKVFMLRITSKVYARFDPCTFKLVVGVDTFNITFNMADLGITSILAGFDKKIHTGLKLDVMGGIELIVRIKLEKGEKAMLLSVGAGFCAVHDENKCQGFFYVLEDAVTPLPICNEDGTMTWPDIDLKSLFDFESLKKKLKDTGLRLAKDGLDRLLKVLPCISPTAPGKTAPCPRPERLTQNMLKSELTRMGLDSSGSQKELADRLREYQRSCRYDGSAPIPVPPIPDPAMDKMIMLKLAPDCMRIDLCVDLNIPQLGFQKSIRTYMHLEPCKITLTINFEECTKKIVLLGYEWGTDKMDYFSKNFALKYNVDVDDVKTNYVLSMGMMIDLGEGKPLVDAMFVTDIEVPIPKCKGKTPFADGTMLELAFSLGGKLNKEAIDALLMKFKFNEVFTYDKCELPKSTKECPVMKPDYKPSVGWPDDYKNRVSCNLDCGGVHCCVDYLINNPLFEVAPEPKMMVYMKLDTCALSVEIGYGKYKHKENLLSYSWGTLQTLGIAEGETPPINVTYVIDKADQDFVADMNVTTCIDIDNGRYCYPEGPLVLMEHVTIPGCNQPIKVLKKKEFMMTEWIKDQGLDPQLAILPQTATDELLKKFKISDHLQAKRCDPKRAPYDPQVKGWRNDCPESTRKLPDLPDGVRCHLTDNCTKVDCCFNVPFLGNWYQTDLDIDVCKGTISAALEKETSAVNLMKENLDLSAGVTREVKLGDVFKMSFHVKKDGPMLHLDYDVDICFEKNKCLNKYAMLSDTELPTSKCTVGDVKKFSLSKWASEKGLEEDSLSKSSVDRLLQELGVKDKMLDKPCDRKGLKYQPADSSQWKNDCHSLKISSAMPTLTLPANCHLDGNCLAVDCCMDSDKLKLPIHTTFHIDMCNHFIEGSIEKFSYKISTVDYAWGTESVMLFDKNPLVKLTFRIERLLSQSIFLVDLKISLCLETDKCEMELQALRLKSLPMPFCPEVQGFKIKDFSVKKWVDAKGGTMDAQLSDELLKAMDISRFVIPNQCAEFREPFKGAKNQWNKVCKASVSLPTLPKNVLCHVAASCTSVTCCVDVAEVKRSFQVFINIDSCNKHLEVGIEKRTQSYSLFDYEWETPQEVDLGGLVKAKYKVKKLLDRKYILSLELKVCLEANQPCETTVPVFKDTLLSAQTCHYEDVVPDVDVSAIIEPVIGQPGKKLNERDQKRLLEALEVQPYLKEQACTFLGRGANGWRTGCPSTEGLSDLPSTASCSLSDTCKTIECCLDVPFLTKKIKYNLELDMCKPSLSLVIEKMEYTKMLFKYHWGTPDTFNLNGVFRADFVLDYFKSQSEVLLGFNISACFQHGKKCDIVVPVAKNMKIKTKDCGTDDSLSDFDLVQWKEMNNINPSAEFSEIQRAQLENAMGISEYVNDPMCDRESGKFKADSTGWNKACPKDVKLTSLPKHMSCHIPEHCTGVQCCVTVDSLGRNFKVGVDIDTPNQVMSAGIEKLYHNKSLLNYQFGKTEDFNLQGVVKSSFKIDDFKSSSQYLMNMNLSVCADKKKPCDKQIQVMKDVTLPKLTRDWTNKEQPTGFSFKKWQSTFNIQPGQKLTAEQQRKLLNNMELLEFLNKPECSRNQDPYTGAKDGWKNDCSASIPLPALPKGVACHLSDPCGGVQCCMHAEEIGRSFNLKVDINPCAMKLTIKLDKLEFTRAFPTYKWGKVEHYNLKRVIHADIKMEDLSGENVILVYLNASVCVEPDSCLLDFPILNGVKIPKPNCKWNNLETLKDFSLDDFLFKNGASSENFLSPVVAAKLYEKYDLGAFLKQPECSKSSPEYSPANNGWKNECKMSEEKSIKTALKTALPDNLVCQMGDICTDINCCVHIEYLARSFNMFLKVDTCNYKLTIGIEKHVHHHMLFDYVWGKKDHFYLRGVLRLDYVINKLSTSRSVEMSMKISVCLKANHCLFSHQLLDKAKIPQPPCDWSKKANKRAFSLEEWVQAHGLPASHTELSDTLITQLLEDLDMSGYLQTPTCDREASPYAPAKIDHWRKECSTMRVPSLHKSANCYLSSSCTDIDCCVDVNIIKRNIQTTLTVDICNLQIHMSIERLTFNLSLLEYEWGTTAHFSVGTVTSLEYKINHIPASTKLILDVKIKVCFEKKCDLEIPILHESELTYTPCPADKTIPFKGQSLDFWSPTKCSSTSLVPSCTASLSGPATSMCQMTDNCMGITCCLEQDFQRLGKYAISAGIKIDQCTDELVFYIEDKHWNETIKTIVSGKNVSRTVGDAITLSYNLTQETFMYSLSFHVKMCIKVDLDKPENCLFYNLMDGVEFQAKSCNSGPAFGRKKRSFLDNVFQKKDPDEMLKGFIGGDNPTIKGILNNKMVKGVLSSDFVKNLAGDNEMIKGLLEGKISNEHVKSLLGIFKNFEDKDKAFNYEHRFDSIPNPSASLKKMGFQNPKTILYSGDVDTQYVRGHLNVGLVGADKIVNLVSKVSEIIGRGDQSYVVGSGLTTKGSQLLGAKLANMSIGQLTAMMHEMSLSPVTAFKLAKQLRELAMTIYSDVFETFFNGKIMDYFKSFDIVLKGDFEVPRQNIEFFRYKQFFLVGGIVPMTFEFGIGATFGLKLGVGAKLLGLKVAGTLIPYAGAHAWGELGIGFVLYGKLRLEGFIMTVAFPTTCELTFSKWPIQVRLIMDLELVPLEIALYGLVTLEVNLGFVKVNKVLFQAKIFSYTTPTINTRILDKGTKELDVSPPQTLKYVQHLDRRKRADDNHKHCLVRQLHGRDYTNPGLEIAAAAREEESYVEIHVKAGTEPGLNDVIGDVQLGGTSVVLNQHLEPNGVPIYFTVMARNKGTGESVMTCEIPTYDITLPAGRLQPDFLSTSNPAELRASIVVLEDSELLKSDLGVGLGMGIYADEVVPYHAVDLKSGDSRKYDPKKDHDGLVAITHFNGLKHGRLIGPIVKKHTGTSLPSVCARMCMEMPPTKCLSFNFEYGKVGTCELLEAVENPKNQLAISGDFVHYERLGIGLAKEFVFTDLDLLHNAMYYFNMHMENVLNYTNIVHSHGVLIDTTPPLPGPLANVSLDHLEVEECLEVVAEDRPDWRDRCKGINPKVDNHRIIRDGPGSMTLFNGEEPLQDLKYTRANNFITSNWDGIYDPETGILGYTWTVGMEPCEELIHPHHDPHKHLLEEAEWTHIGLIAPPPKKYNPLPDGKYYVTLRAINKVEYGGPGVTTICHTTPLGIDNTRPNVYEIYDVMYDEDNFTITAQCNVSDPESDIRDLDLCLGQSTRDCYHLDWERTDHDGSQLNFNFEVPGGSPVWVKVRAINHVNLKTIGVADHPIVIDSTPPIAGTVYDGPIFRHDLNYTKDSDQICANWFGFHDPESGIKFYDLQVFNEAGEPMSEVISVSHKTHNTCVSLPADRRLEHTKNYTFFVRAFNAGHKQLSVSAESNGVIVDLTPPQHGDIVDGRADAFHDLKFSSHVASVGSQWKGFIDPESDIREYTLQILRAKDMSGEFEIIKDWTSVDKNFTDIEWHNFHLRHRDQVKTNFRAINNALGTTEQMTDGFVVDLTPPRMTFIGDGSVAETDAEFQESDDTIDAVFNFFDNESGLEHFKYQVYELLEGNKHQIYPVSGGWETIHDWHATSLRQSGLKLKEGALYSVRVGAVNRAGAVATYDTNGVLLDKSEPEMLWVYVGIFSGDEEELTDGYMIQADPHGIKATWFAEDTESGIMSYMVAVGTTKDDTDILEWTDVGSEKDRYINKLTLNVTNPDTMTPVYYVKVKATNGAGMTSSVLTSNPVQVVEQDKAGIVIDGADSTERSEFGADMDYQRQDTVVTAQFNGFESHVHGMTYFDWAVGTTPGGEEVQPFIMAGLIHKETEAEVAGNGIASMGFGQAVLPLQSGVKYYTTVRGITNGGNILESTSDGFVIDQTPPTLNFESYATMANKTRLHPGVVISISEVDSLSSTWKVTDGDSPIKKVTFSLGTYPYAEDVHNTTEIHMITEEASLPIGVTPIANGQPNVLTITAENEVGLSSSIVSPSLVVDVSPPSVGLVDCPLFIQPQTSEECRWSGFFDTESSIVAFEFAMGSSQGSDDIIPTITLPGHANHQIIQGLEGKVIHGQSYFVKVAAINSIGKQTGVVSKPISVDTTPPIPGTVIELRSSFLVNASDSIATETLNNIKCDTKEECLKTDAVCQESLTIVGVAWEAFVDMETKISKYEVAVGTTPGGGELKPLFEVEDPNQRYVYIKGLTLKGLRQIFVTVKGTNGAGLSAISVSNGVYISYLSQGLEALTHIGIMDGDSKHGDLDYQTSLSTIHAQWDVSGDPCPVVKYEWAIQRADGLVVQDFLETEGRTYGVNDQLQLKNKERYYQLLRVTNVLGFTYTLGSNGITVRDQALVPGEVNDGDVVGFDLQFLRTVTKVSANWDKFGSDGNAGEEEKEIRADDVPENEDRSQQSNQEVVYYEVACGTDRRFPKTRDNVVPFTNVGLNKTVTFYDLELVPIDAIYYFTVRAHSAAGAVVEVTSNGFSVGFDGKVEVGPVNMNTHIHTTGVVDAAWSGFSSQVGMMMYYAGISNNTDAAKYSCGDFTERGSLTDEDRKKVMNVADIQNVGKDTAFMFRNLSLQQNENYVLWVVGVDKAGVCNITSWPFKVDTTEPNMGKIRAGPYYDMGSSYTAKPDQMEISWKDFVDEESDIRCFHASLLKRTGCGDDTSEEVVIESLKLDANLTSYTFMDLDLQEGTPYFVRFSAENKAGLKVTTDSAPVLYDDSVPSAGQVVDGHVFTKDSSWSGSANSVKGTFLHHPVPDESACPVRPVKFNGPEWKFYESSRNVVGTNSTLDLTFRAINVHTEADKVEIKLARDTKKRTMLSGAYYRNADIASGGEYKFSLRAAGGSDGTLQGQVLTSILFWDGPEDYILDYDYTPKPDWSSSNCICCNLDPVPEACKCNCAIYLKAQELKKVKMPSTTTPTTTTITMNPNMTTSTAETSSTTASTTSSATTFEIFDYEEEEELGGFRPSIMTVEEVTKFRRTGKIPDKIINLIPKRDPQNSCGLQIFSSPDEKSEVKGRLLSWCKFADLSISPVESVRELSVDPSLEYHNYTISFTAEREESRDSGVTWCMTVNMDGDVISEQCGIPHLSSDTKMFLGVWNHKNFMPYTPTDENSRLRVWNTRASFMNLILPPEPDKLCRFGKPFQGGINAIVRYEAGIGSAQGLADIVPFREVYTPCVPCLKPCDRFSCNETCDRSATTNVKFTLDDLELKETTAVNGEKEPVPYFLTVKAVLGSGTSATASSDGFSVDTTPPVFDAVVMLYFDLSQGNFTPSDFQGSNNSIKAIWKCDDSESEVVNYEWAIGLQPGGTELQDFESTGEYPGGTNSSFEGILTHNTTYYVTVKCTNGGGLTTTYEDEKGVTVLLEDPNVDDVEVSLPDAEPLPDNVIPDNAMKSKDENSVGASWTISSDPSIKRYDFCVGSSETIPDDIFPCTWVGFNESGTVHVKNGYLLLNDQIIHKLSHYRPDAADWDTKAEGGEGSGADKDSFTMAPGTEMFIFMKMCNEANRCTAKLIGSSVVESETSMMVVSDGSPIHLSLGSGMTRGKRAVSDVSVLSPDGLEPGQSLLTTELTRHELEREYRSDASTDFVPFISDPAVSTADDASLERILRRRVKYSKTDVSFSVTSIGSLSMPGPLSISFPYDRHDEERVAKLLHWNPDIQQWQDSSRSCVSEVDTVVKSGGKITVKVCDTRYAGNATRQRRSTAPDVSYFKDPTQFLITPVLIKIPNTAPQLTGPTVLSMREDEGAMVFPLSATDPDDDEFKFRLNKDRMAKNMDVTLSDQGLLMYTPPKNFHGTVEIPIIIYEILPAELGPLTVDTNVTVHVKSVNDAPAAFALSHNANILKTDPTEPIPILLEQMRENETLPTVYSLHFGAFDVDEGDTLKMFHTEPKHGVLTLGNVVTTPPDCSKRNQDIDCNKLALPHSANDLNWAYRSLQYTPDTGFYGNDEIRLYVQDRRGLFSDVITLKLVVMERPCKNNAKCRSKNKDEYTCNDYRRAEGFDLHYTCECPPGWVGDYCDENVNECDSSPCRAPHICYDLVNGYFCACPAHDLNCDGIESWMIGLIVLVIILLGVISFLAWYSYMVKRGRLKWSTFWRRIAGERVDVAESKTAFVNQGCDEDITDVRDLTPSVLTADLKVINKTWADKKTATSKYFVPSLDEPSTSKEVSIPKMVRKEQDVKLTKSVKPESEKCEDRGVVTQKKPERVQSPEVGLTPRQITVLPKSASAPAPAPSPTPSGPHISRPGTPCMGDPERSMTPVERNDERPGSGYSLLRAALTRGDSTITLADKPNGEYQA